MSLRFCSLGSGSEGNALLVERGRTTLMLDCGFSIRETERRLARAGKLPGDIGGIVVTHEHSDHIGGVARFAARYGVPVWLTEGSARFIESRIADRGLLRTIEAGQAFSIGDIALVPFAVPHDAAEPVQFVFSDGARRLGVLTDVGISTAQIESSLSGCEALVLECNHDLELLLNGPYPAGLKKRVAGKFGHLDNGAAAALLRAIDCSRLMHLVAAHLSKTNNRPELARSALASALGCGPEWVVIAEQSGGFSWREV